MTFVVTDRITIREITPEDFDQVAAIYAAHMGMLKGEAATMFRAWLKLQRYVVRPYTQDSGHFEAFVLVENSTSAVIGVRRFKIRGLAMSGVEAGLHVLHPDKRGNGYFMEVERAVWRALYTRLGITHTEHLLNDDALAMTQDQGGLLRVVETLENTYRAESTLADWEAYSATLAAEAFDYQGNLYEPPGGRTAPPVIPSGDLPLFQPADEGDGIRFTPEVKLTAQEIESNCPGASAWLHHHKFAECATRAEILRHIQRWHTGKTDEQLRRISANMILEQMPGARGQTALPLQQGG